MTRASTYGNDFLAHGHGQVNRPRRAGCTVSCPWSVAQAVQNVQAVLSSGFAGFVQIVETQVASRQSLISKFAIRNLKFTSVF